MEEIKPIPAKGINGTAVRVLSKNRDKQVEFGKTHHISSSSPLPMRPYVGDPKRNLTGKKIGRFEVIGVFIFKPNNKKKYRKGIKWVVRCNCGRYEVMTHKGINHVLEHGCKYEMKCQACRKTEILNRESVNNKSKLYERTHSMP